MSKHSLNGSLLLLATILILMSPGCNRTRETPASAPQTPASTISVNVNGANSLIIKSSAAQFDLRPDGYITASLLDNSGQTTLDDPGPAASAITYDLAHATVTDAKGKLGPAGKRVEVTGTDSRHGYLRKLAIEVYDNFPALAVMSSQYTNSGSKDTTFSPVENEHRLSAAVQDPSKKPYELWSFQGSSEDWGKNDVLPLKASFHQQNVMGSPVNEGHGGGIPVVAFWTNRAGVAVGHLETLPLAMSIPVSAASDGRVQVAVDLNEVTIKPGEVYSSPRTFVAVFKGDYYEPLRMYSKALQQEGWQLPKPNAQDYNVAWCGWGYEFNVTPAQMTGTIPKLKELGIKWATLDDRWFDTYGDWNPRKDTFPGDSIKKMVDDFHKQGMYAQIWWLPLGVEDGTQGYESHKYKLSDVAKEHPDWLILNKDGRPAHIIRNLASLCPAVPEVQQYYKQLTEKFIRDWGFDGHKMDNIYSVPACYNPKHHHKSPQDSINAVADVYRIIYETTRSLKPESVTQICPCGTTPNLAWVPYMDQAVTADPVGGVQVRRRIKMYKALMGPDAAVYGDHVELSEMLQTGKDQWKEFGRDFASTIGTGGVVGTKFTWPDNNPKFRNVALTPDKDALWKKWIGLYNDKMLSKGEFLNLYTIGYDNPEGYAIKKDGKMYYAFFAATPQSDWQGKLELRGLQPGKYHVVDYANNRDLGTVDATQPVIDTRYKGSLLLEVSSM
jgi:alpha-galactosidase